MIRPARTTDAQAICAIWNPVIRDSIATFNSIEKTPADVITMIRDKIATGYAFLVAEQGDALLGFATYGQFRGGIGYRHTGEHTIILDPAAKGQGLGRALMAGICDHARATGMHSLWAGVSAENTQGVTFHDRLGFDTIARLPQVGRKFERWHDLVLMQKRL